MGDTTVIRFVGEVDITNIDEVSVQAGALCAEAKAVALDFTDLTYIDSAGLRLIDDLACQCDRRGARFLVVVPKAAMTRRLLELTLPEISLVEVLDATPESGTDTTSDDGQLRCAGSFPESRWPSSSSWPSSELLAPHRPSKRVPPRPAVTSPS